MKKTEQRFKGEMSEEYKLIREVMPNFESLQQQISKEVQTIQRQGNEPLSILDLGCGDGVTAFYILSQNNNVAVTCLDNEPKMLVQAKLNLDVYIKSKHCTLEKTDVLEYLKSLPSKSTDVVATALTLHNFNQFYRAQVHRQIYRILKIGGHFINADKYAPQNEQTRFDNLNIAVDRFFNTFVPNKKLKLLQNWVLHNIADQSPERVMREDDTLIELRNLGFTASLKNRENMEALLTAKKV